MHTRRQFLLTTAALPLAAAPKPLDAVRMGVIGTGRRGVSLMRSLVRIPNTTVTALCDLDPQKVAAGSDVVQSAGQPKPAAIHGGPLEYRRLLERRDVDAVLIATPNNAHAAMAVDAMAAGKHVLSEVPGATTLDDCWRIVRAAEKSGAVYMLAENVCYYRSNLAVGRMVREGIFGETTYAECGYVHDTRELQFLADGSPTWRSDRAQLPGNRYPTHGIGPVAQWLGNTRGDRFASLVSMSSLSASLPRYLKTKFGPDSAPARTRFAADSNVTLLKTARGKLIELRFDPYSAKPHPSTTYQTLQGVSASYRDSEGEQRIWIESRSEKFAWEPLEKYQAEFDSPLWKKWSAEALKTGHRGADFLTMLDFIEALRTGGPSPIDVYDSAFWSAIIPLSEASVTAGSRPVEFPDFTSGRWQERKP